MRTSISPICAVKALQHTIFALSKGLHTHLLLEAALLSVFYTDLLSKTAPLSENNSHLCSKTAPTRGYSTHLLPVSAPLPIFRTSMKNQYICRGPAFVGSKIVRTELLCRGSTC